MEKLTVLVDDVENDKRFLNNLFTEIGDEFNVDVKDKMVSFYNINNNNFNTLCNCLAKAIMQEYEKKLLVKAVNKICECYAKYEKIEIWKIAMHQLLKDYNSNNNDYCSRLRSVTESLSNYLNESDVLSLKGFVNFRLNEYSEELEDIAELSAREYTLELEYKEFIVMLKYFLSLQKPKYMVVEVVYGREVTIFADGMDVTDECMEEYRTDVGLCVENKDDFVLNSLIVIAPKTVKISITDDVPEKELINTIKGVFGDKVVVRSVFQ